MNGSLQATEETFDALVLQAADTILVEFWAEWCGPCRAVSPILDAIEAEHPGALRVVRVNADDNPELAATYRVTSIPAMLVFREGVVAKTIIGAKPKPALEHELAPYLG